MSDAGPDATAAAGVVLVVEDNTKLRELFASWLEPVYDVRTAPNGDVALDRVDEAVDVVLLDRNLPELSGDEVLERIRSRGLDCKVSMVTAVEPTTAIVVMDFDEYLVKPVDRQELLRAVESLLAREEYGSLVERYFELTAKLGVLEETESAALLDGDEDYQDLVAEHERVAELLSAQQESLLAAGDYDRLFADLKPG